MAETSAIRAMTGSAFPGCTCGDVSLRELSFGTAWNLQGDPANPAFLTLAERWLGVALPLAPHTTACASDWSALWLGPRTWLLLAGPQRTSADFITRRDACNELGGALFDLSASRVVFEIGGPGAAELLAAFSPLDLHPSAFPPGACAQSLCGHVAALYHAPAAGIWQVHVARSLGRDVWASLCASAARRGTGAQPP